MPIDAPSTRFEGACASATVAIRHGVLLVASGVYDLVMMGGTERTTIMGNVVDIDPARADMELIGKAVSIGYRLIDNEAGEGPDEGVAFTFSIRDY
jgi:acetyl-CoA acetyltransferase